MPSSPTAICEWCNRQFAYEPSTNPKKIDRPRFCSDQCVRNHRTIAVTFALTHIPWPGPWAEDGTCAQPPTGTTPPEWTAIWFDHDQVELAKRICETCPVIGRCNKYALDAGPALHGVWGGLSEKDRARIRRSREPQERTTP